ncbi:NAD(P)H-dependent oxidoreductase subunit E [Candidatus Gracilibacteria bacterium]|nr:NAD(P)H-dependent oxidoreductase subunit E [Candidatus Gracilibacteria bacterium]MBS9784169.1 NAD(P)H-dependent oxidoreductase subunit E [Candidatus Gracilibacteria bacterium]
MIDCKVCTGKSCTSSGSAYILQRIENDKIGNEEKYKNLNISTCSCQGKCKEAIVVVVDDIKYTRQNPATVSKMLREKVEKWKAKK